MFEEQGKRIKQKGRQGNAKVGLNTRGSVKDAKVFRAGQEGSVERREGVLRWKSSAHLDEFIRAGNALGFK